MGEHCRNEGTGCEPKETEGWCICWCIGCERKKIGEGADKITSEILKPREG